MGFCMRLLLAEDEEDGEPVTKEEALEMAEMEIKAKGIKNYVQSTPEKKSTKNRLHGADHVKQTKKMKV